jgi:hypothetical protein
MASEKPVERKWRYVPGGNRPEVRESVRSGWATGLVCVVESLNPIDDAQFIAAAPARIAALEAENARMRDAAIDAAASLAAAISLLERTPKAKKAAPSDRMFAQMLDDYRASLERARAALR